MFSNFRWVAVVPVGETLQECAIAGWQQVLPAAHLPGCCVRGREELVRRAMGVRVTSTVHPSQGVLLLLLLVVALTSVIYKVVAVVVEEVASTGRPVMGHPTMDLVTV